MPTVNINGHQIHYLEKGQGRPVILVHGFPLDHRVWAGQIDALAENYRMIAVDLPGFGQSRAAGPFTIQSLAETLRGLAQQIDAIPCVVAGLSMGGYVILAWAKLCPTDIDGMILVDTKADGDTAEARENRNRMIELAAASGSSAIADDMLPKLIAPQTLSHQPQTVQTLRAMIEDQPAQTIQWALAAMRDREDLVDFLKSIADPALIIVGEHDKVTPPEGARRMQQSIQQAQLAIIPDCGHLPPIEKPRETAEAISSFLRECL